MVNFEININTLLELKLGFEAYFVLYCVHAKDKQLITNYTTQCKKINTDIFKQLQSDGYLEIANHTGEHIYFELLSLANKGHALFSESATSTFDLEKQFGEFRACYPMMVKEGFKTRRLHGNLSKCKRLYEKLLMETTHDILCKTAQLYTQEQFKSGQIYMQSLETWLFQKNYTQFLQDLDKQIEKADFTDDI